MTETIIHIDLDALDARLDGGELWTHGWGDWQSPDGVTCLHGAIRSCQPVPGDAYLIEQVGERFGFGIKDNDIAVDWAEIRAKVQPDITDEILAETFGPQWREIVALVRRAATLTVEDAAPLAAAWDAARAAVRAAARDAVRAAARDAARAAARDAAWDAARAAVRAAARAAAWDAARAAAWAAAVALSVRDLIGKHDFTQQHYDTLTGPWASTIGPVHPDDKPVS